MKQWVNSLAGALLFLGWSANSAFGQNVYAEDIINESKKEINLNNAAAGIYFVKVYVYPDSIGNAEKYYCRKIVVEHD